MSLLEILASGLQDEGFDAQLRDVAYSNSDRCIIIKHNEFSTSISIPHGSTLQFLVSTYWVGPHAAELVYVNCLTVEANDPTSIDRIIYWIRSQVWPLRKPAESVLE